MISSPLLHSMPHIDRTSLQHHFDSARTQHRYCWLMTTFILRSRKQATLIRRYSMCLNAPHALSGSILFWGKDIAKIDGKLYTFQHAGDGALEIKLYYMSFGNRSVEVNYSMLLKTGCTYWFLPFNILR